MPHFRLPSIAHGVTSLLWAILLGFFVWGLLLSAGVGGATAFVVACLSAFLIFLFVRVYGEEEPRRR